MTFLEEFKKRGYFYQCTNEDSLSEKMSKQKIVAYIGFDCTAKSLHVGNLMQVMIRSEERRVGKEGRARWSPEH